MFASGFASGWGAMDQTIRGQQELDMRRQEMAETSRLRQQDMAFRERQFQFQQQTEQRRSRLEAARMFNELVQMNPNASADDLAALAGQVYGGFGMNDAIPGRDSLERMANGLAARRREVEEARRLELLDRQLRTQSLATDLATRFAGSMPLAEGYDAFKKAAGPLGSTFSLDAFTALKRQVDDENIRKNLPLALSLAEKGVPLRSQFPGMPSETISALDEAVKREREQKAREEELRLEQTESQRMLRMITTGVPYIPSDTLPPALRERFAGEYEAYNKREAGRKLVAFEDELARTPDYVSRILTGQGDAVRREVAARARRMMDRDLTADELEQLMARLNSAATAQQTTTVNATRANIVKEADSLAERQLEQTKQQVSVLLDNKENREQIFGSGDRGKQIADAFKVLVGQGYAFTDQQLIQMGQRLQRDQQLGASGVIGMSDLMAAVQRDRDLLAAFQEADPRNVRSSVRDRALQSSGIFDSEAADAYVTRSINRFTSNIDAGTQKVSTEVRTLLANTELPPTLKVSTLENKLAQIERERASIQMELQSRLRFAANWVRPGSRPFTEQDMARILEAYDQSLAPKIEVIREGITLAKADRNRPQPRPADVPPERPSPMDPAGTRNDMSSREDLLRRELGTTMPAEMRGRELDRIKAEREQEAEARAKIAATRRAQGDARLQAIANELQDPYLPPEERTRLMQEANRIIDEYRE